uniref:Reverse transcriptase domain-containing protein n=1 Tax=Opuntia streptacantha TaxID=393608 RepID=A0A7C9AMW1_OPUST
MHILSPEKDYFISRIKGMKWFASLDAKSGYYQLRLHPNTIPLTAFSCPAEKLYEWKVLPFGLKQVPSIFQKYMSKNLEGLEEYCLVYIDDILIFSKQDKEDHLQKLLTVLQRCKDRGIVLSKKKAQLCKQEIDFLGLT